MHEESIFTKIIKGEIPSHKVYEDEYTYAFLDIHPTVPGHTLIVPKVQRPYIWDMTDEEYQSLMNAVKKVGTHLKEVLGTPYVGTMVVGVEVPHAHVHILPFYDVADLKRSFELKSDTPNHEELEQMAKKIAF